MIFKIIIYKFNTLIEIRYFTVILLNFKTG